jgi:hypothetical protein
MHIVALKNIHAISAATAPCLLWRRLFLIGFDSMQFYLIISLSKNKFATRFGMSTSGPARHSISASAPLRVHCFAKPDKTARMDGR